MQTTNTKPNRNSRKTNHYGSQNGHQPRRKQTKKPNASSKFDARNSFLTHHFEDKSCPFPPIAENVGDTYKYLLKSAKRYAKLLGVSLTHDLQNEPMKGIKSLYLDLKKILPQWQELNLEIFNDDGLAFVVYEEHKVYYNRLILFSMKGIDKGLKGKTKNVIQSFMAHLFNANGFTHFLHDWNHSVIFENMDTKDDDDPYIDYTIPLTTKSELHFLSDANKPKFSKKKTLEYLQSDIFDKEDMNLILALREGIPFVSGNENLIEDYSYNYIKFEADYPPIYVENQIRFVYSLEGFDGRLLIDMMDDGLNNGQESLVPASNIRIDPNMRQTLKLSSYPDAFLKWSEKITQILLNYERNNN